MEENSGKQQHWRANPTQKFMLSGSDGPNGVKVNLNLDSLYGVSVDAFSASSPASVSSFSWSSWASVGSGGYGFILLCICVISTNGFFYHLLSPFQCQSYSEGQGEKAF